MLAAIDASQRGVDMQLILSSFSDFSPVLLAGQSNYQRLLDAGVKVHELLTAVLHAKTADIDGVLSNGGLSNMDWRSFAGASCAAWADRAKYRAFLIWSKLHPVKLGYCQSEKFSACCGLNPRIFPGS